MSEHSTDDGMGDRTGGVEEHAGIAEVPAADWNRLTGPDTSDLHHGYLAFREWLEPGEPLVLTRTEGGVPAGGLHAVRATPRSGLFSHPWKMLADEQFLRIGDAHGADGTGDAEAAAVRKEHHALLDAAGAAAAAGGAGAADGAAGRWGEVLVVRGFDRSAVPSGDERVIGELVGAAQRRSRGALVFPFVDPGDIALRNVLRRAGFRQGTVTAAAVFHLAGQADYEAFVAGLPGRFRRHHVREEKIFAASGLTVREVPLTGGTLDRVVGLEAQNSAKHGGSPDVERLRQARRRLAHLVPGGVRVPAVYRDDRMIACGVHLVCSGGYHVLGYGCDYAVADRSTAYHHLTFYGPLRFCLAQGLDRCRLGFEEVAVKHRRGARIHRREMWVWAGDAALLSRLGDLLSFIDQRNTEYLSRYGA